MTRKAATLEVLKDAINRLRQLRKHPKFRKYMKLAPLAMLFILPLHAQAPVTENWTISKSTGCVPTVRYPSYYCFANATDSSGNVSTLVFYIQVNADGSFSNGQISMSDLYGNAPTFSANNWAGANLSGTFSGTNPDGTSYSGSATIVLGTWKPTGYCSRYGCPQRFGPVGGSVAVTFGE